MNLFDWRFFRCSASIDDNVYKMVEVVPSFVSPRGPEGSSSSIVAAKDVLINSLKHVPVVKRFIKWIREWLMLLNRVRGKCTWKCPKYLHILYHWSTNIYLLFYIPRNNPNQLAYSLRKDISFNWAASAGTRRDESALLDEETAFGLSRRRTIMKQTRPLRGVRTSTCETFLYRIYERETHSNIWYVNIFIIYNFFLSVK